MALEPREAEDDLQLMMRKGFLVLHGEGEL
jgi:hypothetical protein